MLRTTRKLASASLPAGLLRLEEVPTHRSWDFSMPTLVKADRLTQRAPWASSGDRVAKHIETSYPVVHSVMGPANGRLTLKGGALSSILLDQAPSDLDLYVTGTADVRESMLIVKEALRGVVRESKERALKDENEAIEQEQVLRSESRQSPIRTEEIEQRRERATRRAVSNVQAVRRGSVITVEGIHGMAMPLQFNLRPHESLIECMLDGDVDAGAVSFSPEQGMILTPRGAFAIQNWTIHATRPASEPWQKHQQPASASQSMRAPRLDRYFDAGFDIILPGLNMHRIPPTHPLVKKPIAFAVDRGQFVVEASKVSGNVITVSSSRLLRHVDAQDAHPSSVPRRRRRRQPKREISEQCALHNVKELLRGGKNFRTFAYGEGIAGLAKFDVVPVSSRTISSQLRRAATIIQQDPHGPDAIRQLVELFPCAEPRHVLSSLMRPINRLGVEPDDGGKHVQDRLDELVAQQMDAGQGLVKQRNEALAGIPLADLLPDLPVLDVSDPEFYGEFAVNP